ncbi:Acyl-coenzyme A thioesterase 11 [Xenoophorus captivus]|uniref:Acyl-coenzyme A thioesterase 11 n=1 Tax=Xenoophorus captivus TaxID=1517983 RepID=A0ABV0QV41_9TELE
MFHFRGPSHIGDRLVLKAIVNNAFKHSMEVGVCAEAYRGGEPLRHINSAFMTFEVLDGDRKPRTLPHLRPEPGVVFSELYLCHLETLYFVWIKLGFPVL